MPRHQTGNPMLRILRSRAVFIGLMVVVVVLLSGLSKKMVQSRRIADEITALEQEIAGIEHRNAELSELITYLKSDDFVEREARTKLNMRKPGETAVIISDPRQRSIPDEARQDEKPRYVPNYERWWSYFFGPR